MAKPIMAVERGARDRAPIYVRFSNSGIERTEAYASGEINVDVDIYNQVVGIEMLSIGAAQLKVLAEIVAQYDLDVSRLFGRAKY